MADFGVFPFDGGDQRAEISRTPLLAPPDEIRRAQSDGKNEPPNQPRVPARETVNHNQQKQRDRHRRPAKREPAAQPRAAERGLHRTQQILEAAFHHVVTSTVFSRRASQPLKIISPNITTSTPTINQRQSFCRFSSSARCKCS